MSKTNTTTAAPAPEAAESQAGALVAANFAELPDAAFGALVPASSPMATMLNADMYNQLKVVAKHFAGSQLIPQHFRDKPHDVFIALHMAHRLGCDPILVLQNLYIVHGQPGWKSQFIIAQANLSGVFRGRIRFNVDRTDPKNMRVTALATMKDGGEEVSATVDMHMARLEGWTNNKKYDSMPEHMLSYRAATFLVRRYAPEVMLGVPVVDEVEDMAAAARTGSSLPADTAAPPAKSAAEIAADLQAKSAATAAKPTIEAEKINTPAAQQQPDDWTAAYDRTEAERLADEQAEDLGRAEG